MGTQCGGGVHTGCMAMEKDQANEQKDLGVMKYLWEDVLGMARDTEVVKCWI